MQWQNALLIAEKCLVWHVWLGWRRNRHPVCAVQTRANVHPTTNIMCTNRNQSIIGNTHTAFDALRRETSNP